MEFAPDSSRQTRRVLFRVTSHSSNALISGAETLLEGSGDVTPKPVSEKGLWLQGKRLLHGKRY